MYNYTVMGNNVHYAQFIGFESARVFYHLGPRSWKSLDHRESDSCFSLYILV